MLLTLPELAVMLVVADEVRLCPVATPELEMVAALVFEDVQVTSSVTTEVLPSSKVAFATNAWVSPEVIDALLGVTAMDARLARVMLTLVAPLTDPDVAVIVAAPAATPLTRPELPTVAVFSSDVDQVAELVRFFVLPSL